MQRMATRNPCDPRMLGIRIRRQWRILAEAPASHSARSHARPQVVLQCVRSAQSTIADLVSPLPAGHEISVGFEMFSMCKRHQTAGGDERHVGRRALLHLSGESLHLNRAFFQVPVADRRVDAGGPRRLRQRGHPRGTSEEEKRTRSTCQDVHVAGPNPRACPVPHLEMRPAQKIDCEEARSCSLRAAASPSSSSRSLAKGAARGQDEARHAVVAAQLPSPRNRPSLPAIAARARTSACTRAAPARAGTG